MSVDLLELQISSEADVFSARQRARSAARAVGLDNTDQVRAATALSEMGRVIVDTGAEATVTLSVNHDERPELCIVVSVGTPSRDASVGATADAFAACRRLMDSFSVLTDVPLQIRMCKNLTSTAALSEIELAEIRTQLAGEMLATPLEAFRVQNLELLRTLEELTAQQQQLRQLNDELQETNSGVVAMYNQLSAELEQTNRGVVALYADLDERGVQLREANATKSRFLASVSHELRSPLNSVLALTGLMREPDSDDLTAEQEHHLALIASSATQLLDLVNGLLDLAKAEARMLNVAVEEIDLASLLEQLRATLMPTATADVALSFRLPDGAQSLRSDATLLTHLLRNLISNALKFTERGSVTVDVEFPTDAQVMIRVADTGIGIADGDQQRIFEEFVQIPGPLQARVKSTGLGLPYARRVAETLGGTLTVSSELGRGSVFTALLPRALSAKPANHASIGTVLIVDDEVQFRQLARSMVQDIAVRVLEADSADGAIDLMTHTRPDLILLDLRMPVSGGRDVLAYVRSVDSLREVAVVIVSSGSLDDEPDLGLADAKISKHELTQHRLLEIIGATRAKEGK